MSPTEIAAKYPSDVIEAYEWIKIYCQHWATINNDWQTLDGLFGKELEQANEYLELLTRHGLVSHAQRPPKQKPGRCGKPNFKLSPL